MLFDSCFKVFFSSRRRHTICALVTGVQTCALPICEPSDPRAVGQAFGRQIEAAVDFYLHRVDRLSRPAVGANDMPARIRLVARHDFAKAPRGCHYPRDQPFARAVATTIAADDSRTVPRLPARDRRPRMEIAQEHTTKAAPRAEKRDVR